MSKCLITNTLQTNNNISMITVLIISGIALYWLGVLVWWFFKVYNSRRSQGLPLPLEGNYKFDFFRHIVYFLIPVLFPFHLIEKLIESIRQRRIDKNPNMPGPVPKYMRGFLFPNRVIDRANDNTVMTLTEYNEKYHTQYTYQDIYGKRYVKKYLKTEQE